MKSYLLSFTGLFILVGVIGFSINAQTTPQEIPTTPDNKAQIMNMSNVNSPYSEYTPFITADEHFLYFQSNRPDGVASAGDFDLWFSENVASQGTPDFKTPANVGLPVNSAYFDGHPSLRQLPSGEYEMYFCSFALDDREGPEQTNIYYTVQKDGKWTTPVPVLEINTDFHDRMPSISQDGHYLYFSSDRPGGFGNDDIWISEYDFAARKWGKPVNAGGTINTPASEVSPAIHSDNITLYFSSNRAGGVGGYDIYFTQRIQNLAQIGSGSENEILWRKSQNLGKPFNSTFDDEYPTVIRNGNYMYFASNREHGKGSFDVYRAKVPDFAKPEVVITLKGRVKEKFSDKGIEANIRITDADGERNFSTQQAEGLYSADLVNKKQYKFVVSAPGYAPIEYIADLRDINSPITIQKNFEMERVVTLPKNATIYITFVNEKGATLKPQVTFRMPPEVQDDTILRFEKKRGVVNVPLMEKYKNVDTAAQALQNLTLEISAELKGYENLHETRLITDVLRGSNGETLENAEIKFVMKKGEATPTVVVTKCKAGNGCVAVAYFSTNIANKLNNEKAAGLKNVVALWNKEPHKYVYVYGHTDSRGGANYNLKLSRARASFIKKRLVEYGIPGEMIITKGMGETQLASKDEKADAGRRLNRRAEIYFDTTKRPGDEVIEDKAAPREGKPIKKKPVKKAPKIKRKPLPPETVEPSAKDNPTENSTKEEAKKSTSPAESAPLSTKPQGVDIPEKKGKQPSTKLKIQ